MGKYFGTDGIRGKYNEELTVDLAFKVGNAISRLGEKIKIVIGKDTRKSGDALIASFSSGALCGGASVTNVGVCPTACISYLTTKFEFDFGVIITASHNPAIYNGIKVFSKSGRKIDSALEEKIEELMSNSHFASYLDVGTYVYSPKLIDSYVGYIDSLFKMDLTGKKIVLDCSNGASSFVAEKLFKMKNADVVLLGGSPNGININENCGALHTENLQKKVTELNANFGYAYDGDADRIIAVTEKGDVLSGDVLIYIFGMYLQKKEKLNPPIVVGTRQTNMGLENELSSKGIQLIRTDIGDKYISLEIEKQGLMLGGETAGHIIINDFLPTGDGVLNSMFLTYIMETTKTKLSDYQNLKLYEQVNLSIEVNNKDLVMESEKLNSFIKMKQYSLDGLGRILVRKSGTEPCIRIMVESADYEKSKEIASQIYQKMIEIDMDYSKI